MLVRAGHTEAAVDVSRLAGLNPSGVICEIMHEDGTMARLDDLVSFAQLHGLKIGTIRDLIAYRRRHDHNVEKIAEAKFESRWGGERTRDHLSQQGDRHETLALVKGRLDPGKPALVRMHALGMFSDMLGMQSPREGLLGRSMETIAEEGSGVVVILARQGPMSDVLHAMAAAKRPGMNELRDYGVGAQILAELGIHDMILLTNSHHTLVALDGYGLNIVGERAIGDYAEGEA